MAKDKPKPETGTGDEPEEQVKDAKADARYFDRTLGDDDMGMRVVKSPPKKGDGT